MGECTNHSVKGSQGIAQGLQGSRGQGFTHAHPHIIQLLMDNTNATENTYQVNQLSFSGLEVKTIEDMQQLRNRGRSKGRQGTVRIYHMSMIGKSFEIDLLRDVTPSVQCLELLKQKGSMPRGRSWRAKVQLRRIMN